jgi:murein DD-endopeptidase MepM/ murein hydrolase activator NlpD
MRLRPPFAFALGAVCLLALVVQADRVPLASTTVARSRVDTPAAILERDVPVHASAANEPSPGPAAATPAAAPGPEWLWPAKGAVTSEFGPRWGRLHAGLDIDAPDGSEIVAPKAGVVISSGWDGAYGNQVLIDHGNGFVTMYAHQRAIAVPVGTRLTQGQLVGWVGCTGSCTGAHLHFEIRINGVPQPPRQFLSGPPPVVPPPAPVTVQTPTVPGTLTSR